MSARGTYSAIRLWILVTLFVSATASAQVREDTWVTNGTVNVATVLGSTVYIGGTFTQMGPAVGSGAAIDGTSGIALSPYPRIDGPVVCVEPDGAGGWFVGGAFTHVRGVPRRSLAQIDANGNVTAWDPSPEGDVRCLLRVGGTLYVGGYFEQISGVSRMGAAAFEVGTGTLTSWDAATDGYVIRLAQSSGRIYISGQFNQVGGQPRLNMAAVDATTGACLAWTGSVGGPVITTWSGILYVSSASGLVGLSESTGQVVISIPMDGGVNAAVPDPATGTIYFGGTFSTVNGVSRGGLAAIDAAAALTAWNPMANGHVLDLALDSGVLVAGGTFATVGGQSRPNLASIGSQNGVVTAWNPRPSGAVLTVRASNGIVYAGGQFTSVNMIPRLNAAAINSSSGSALPWNPGPNGEVTCMAVGSGPIYMGGSFSLVGGLTRRHFAAVDATTGAPTSWTADMTSGDSNRPLTMILSGNTLYTGGDFQIISGVSRKFLAAINATTGAILPWNPNPNSAVTTMQVAVDPTNTLNIIYVGGGFTTVGGVARNYLAAIYGDPFGGLNFDWIPSADNVVSRLAVVVDASNVLQTIYIGGFFTSINGTPRNRVAATDAFGVVAAWNPNSNGNVQAISPAGSRVYIGGAFTTLGGQPIKYLGAVDATTGAPTTWAPQVETNGVPNSGVHTILRLGSTIYVGGNFLSAGGKSSNNFAGLIDGTVTAVVQEPAPPARSVLRAAPNPFGTSTLARFTLPRPEHADVAVYDVAGRRVRQLHHGFMTAGLHTLPWEGSDDRGQTVASGIYFLRVRTPSLDLGAKLHRLR